MLLNPYIGGLDVALWTDSDKGGVKPTDLGQSTMKNTPVSSGPRPVKSVYKIDTSAPENARTLGRDVPGSLK